jgi:hypothetical protein
MTQIIMDKEEYVNILQQSVLKIDFVVQTRAIVAKVEQSDISDEEAIKQIGELLVSYDTALEKTKEKKEFLLS